MLPAPMPVMPLIVLLGIMALLCTLGGIRPLRQALRDSQENPARPRILAAFTLGLGLACFASAVFIATTHEDAYSRVLSKALSQEYGVAPVDDQSVRLGEKFTAVTNSGDAECSVSLPDIVMCGSELVPATAGN